MFMPRWAEPPKAYSSSFVCVCVILSRCLSVCVIPDATSCIVFCDAIFVAKNKELQRKSFGH